MDFFSSSKAKKDAKAKRSSSGLFGKKPVSKSNPASPPHPAGGRSPPPSYDEQTPYWTSERVPNSHPRPPLYGYGTPERERRKDHGRERMDAMSYEAETDAPSSPFHPAENRTQDRMYEADTRSNASPFHPFRSPSPSPYHTPDRRREHNRNHYEAMYEADANPMLQSSAPASPFHPAGSRSPPPYITPDRRSNHGKEQYEDMYELDGDVTPRNSSPPSPFHPVAYRTPDRRSNHGKEQYEDMYELDGDVTPRNSSPPSPFHRAASTYSSPLDGIYYSSSDEEKHSTYLYPEIRTPIRSRNSTPVEHKYEMVAVETQLELPEEKESMISSEAYVSVAKYRVRQSVSETVQAILDKHGDIAAASKLQSMKTRSYYLESLAAVVMELKATALRDLTKTRVAEMAAVVRDMESVKIDVRWVKTAVAELGEAVEYLGKYEAAKVEKEECEREAKAGKGEMEEMRAELERRDKEMKECRERVTVVAGRLGQLEMRGWRLKKNLDLFHSKLRLLRDNGLLVV